MTGRRANPELRFGSRRVIPDLLFEEVSLIVEIDGHQHHAQRQTFESDRERQNLLVSAGYTVLRFT